ncbi:unnamed protein product [Amoebophrya sp. A120]|nr:unnamed protein product [Amoebophrya sp. A120]|eukprot:GSA120T00015864001.1
MGKQIAPPGAEEQEGQHGQAVPFHAQGEPDETNAAQRPEQEPTGIAENVDDGQHHQQKKHSTRSPLLSEDPLNHKTKSASLDRDGLLEQDGHHMVDHNNRDDEQMVLQVKSSSATVAQNVKVGEGENSADHGIITTGKASTSTKTDPVPARASSPSPSSAHDQLHMSFTTKESDSGQENEKVAEQLQEHEESPEGAERIIPSNQVDEEEIQNSDNAAGVTPVSLSSGELDELDRLTKKASSLSPVPPLKFEIISHAKQDIEEEIQMEKQMGMMHNSQNKTKTSNLQQLEKGLDFVKKEISPSNSPRSEDSASSKASSNRSAGRQGWSNALSLLKEKNAIARGEKPNFISVVKAAIRNKKSIQIDNEQAKKMAELKRATAAIAVEAEQSAKKSAGAADKREQYLDPRFTAMSRGSMLPDPRETAQQIRQKSGDLPGAGYDPRMSVLSRGTVLVGKSPRNTAMGPVRGEASASQRISDGSRGTAGSEADGNNRAIPMPEFTLDAETSKSPAPRQSAATSTEINANNHPLPAVPAGSKKKLSVASSSAALRGSSVPVTSAGTNKASTNKENKAATKGSASEQRAASTSSTTTKGKASVNKKSTASNASLVAESSEKRSSSFPKAKVRLYRSKKEQSSAELGEGGGEQQSKEQRKADIVAAAAAGAASSSVFNSNQEQPSAAGASGAASSSLSPRNKKQTDQNCASAVLTNCWAGINLAFATIGCGFSKTEEKKDFKPKQRKLKNSREASPRTQSTSPRGGNLNLRNDGTNMQSVQKESRSTGGTSNAGSSTGRPSNVFASLLASDEIQDRISNFRAALQELDNGFRGSIKRDMDDLVTNRLTKFWGSADTDTARRSRLVYRDEEGKRDKHKEQEAASRRQQQRAIRNKDTSPRNHEGKRVTRLYYRKSEMEHEKKIEEIMQKNKQKKARRKKIEHLINIGVLDKDAPEAQISDDSNMEESLAKGETAEVDGPLSARSDNKKDFSSRFASDSSLLSQFSNISFLTASLKSHQSSEELTEEQKEANKNPMGGVGFHGFKFRKRKYKTKAPPQAVIEREKMKGNIIAEIEAEKLKETALVKQFSKEQTPSTAKLNKQLTESDNLMFEGRYGADGRKQFFHSVTTAFHDGKMMNFKPEDTEGNENDEQGGTKNSVEEAVNTSKASKASTIPPLDLSSHGRKSTPVQAPGKGGRSSSAPQNPGVVVGTQPQPKKKPSQAPAPVTRKTNSQGKEMVRLFPRKSKEAEVLLEEKEPSPSPPSPRNVDLQKADPLLRMKDEIATKTMQEDVDMAKKKSSEVFHDKKLESKGAEYNKRLDDREKNMTSEGVIAGENKNRRKAVQLVEDKKQKRGAVNQGDERLAILRHPEVRERLTNCWIAIDEVARDFGCGISRREEVNEDFLPVKRVRHKEHAKEGAGDHLLKGLKNRNEESLLEDLDRGLENVNKQVLGEMDDDLTAVVHTIWHRADPDTHRRTRLRYRDAETGEIDEKQQAAALSRRMQKNTLRNKTPNSPRERLEKDLNTRKLDLRKKKDRGDRIQEYVGDDVKVKRLSRLFYSPEEMQRDREIGEEKARLAKEEHEKTRKAKEVEELMALTKCTFEAAEAMWEKQEEERMLKKKQAAAAAAAAGSSSLDKNGHHASLTSSVLVSGEEEDALSDLALSGNEGPPGAAAGASSAAKKEKQAAGAPGVVYKHRYHKTHAPPADVMAKLLKKGNIIAGATADGGFEVRSMEDLKVLKEQERQKKEAGKTNLQGTATSATSKANTTQNAPSAAEQQQQEKRSTSKEGKVRLFSRGSKKSEETAGEQHEDEQKPKNDNDSPAKRASKGAKPDKPAAPETRNSKSSEKVRLYARGSSKKEEANPNAGGEQQHEEHKKHHHKSHFGRSFTVEEVGTKEAAAAAAAQQEAPDAKAASTTTGANYKTTSTSGTTTTKTASSTTTATPSNNTSFVQQVAQSEEISERITNFASAWHELVSDFSRGLNTDLPAIKESLRNSLVKVRDEDEEEAKRKKRSGSKEGLVRLHPRKSSKGEEEKGKKEQEAAVAAASSTAVLAEQQQTTAALPSNNNRALSKESLKSAASSYRSPNRGDEVWERYDNFRFSLKELVSDFKRGLNNDWTSLTTAAKNKPKDEGKKRDSKEGLVRLHPRKSKAEEGAGEQAEAGGAAASAAGEKKDTAVGPDTAAAKEQTPAGPAPSCLGQLAAVLGCGSKPPKKKTSSKEKEDTAPGAPAASTKNKDGGLEQTPLTQEEIARQIDPEIITSDVPSEDLEKEKSIHDRPRTSSKARASAAGTTAPGTTATVTTTAPAAKGKAKAKPKASPEHQQQTRGQSEASVVSVKERDHSTRTTVHALPGDQDHKEAALSRASSKSDRGDKTQQNLSVVSVERLSTGSTASKGKDTGGKHQDERKTDMSKVSQSEMDNLKAAINDLLQIPLPGGQTATAGGLQTLDEKSLSIQQDYETGTARSSSTVQTSATAMQARKLASQAGEQQQQQRASSSGQQNFLTVPRLSANEKLSAVEKAKMPPSSDGPVARDSAVNRKSTEPKEQAPVARKSAEQQTRKSSSTKPKTPEEDSDLDKPFVPKYRDELLKDAGAQAQTPAKDADQQSQSASSHSVLSFTGGAIGATAEAGTVAEVPAPLAAVKRSQVAEPLSLRSEFLEMHEQVRKSRTSSPSPAERQQQSRNKKSENIQTQPEIKDEEVQTDEEALTGTRNINANNADETEEEEEDLFAEQQYKIYIEEIDVPDHVDLPDKKKKSLSSKTGKKKRRFIQIGSVSPTLYTNKRIRGEELIALGKVKVSENELRERAKQEAFATTFHHHHLHVRSKTPPPKHGRKDEKGLTVNKPFSANLTKPTISAAIREREIEATSPRASPRGGILNGQVLDARQTTKTTRKADPFTPVKQMSTLTSDRKLDKRKPVPEMWRKKPSMTKKQRARSMSPKPVGLSGIQRRPDPANTTISQIYSNVQDRSVPVTKYQGFNGTQLDLSSVIRGGGRASKNRAETPPVSWREGGERFRLSSSRERKIKARAASSQKPSLSPTPPRSRSPNAAVRKRSAERTLQKQAILDSVSASSKNNKQTNLRHPIKLHKTEDHVPTNGMKMKINSNKKADNTDVLIQTAAMTSKAALEATGDLILHDESGNATGAEKFLSKERQDAVDAEVAPPPQPVEEETPRRNRDPDEDSQTLYSDQETAATKLQANFRGNQARKKVSKEKEEEKNAVLKIQANFRGKETRKKVEKEKEETTTAVTKIQANFKGKQARKEVEKEKKEMTISALKIQANFKGNQVRKQVLSKDKTAAGTTTMPSSQTQKKEKPAPSTEAAPKVEMKATEMDRIEIHDQETQTPRPAFWQDNFGKMSAADQMQTPRPAFWQDRMPKNFGKMSASDQMEYINALSPRSAAEAKKSVAEKTAEKENLADFMKDDELQVSHSDVPDEHPEVDENNSTATAPAPSRPSQTTSTAPQKRFSQARAESALNHEVDDAVAKPVFMKKNSVPLKPSSDGNKDSIPVLSPRNLDHEIAEMKQENAEDIARPKSHFHKQSLSSPRIDKPQDLPSDIASPRLPSTSSRATKDSTTMLASPRIEKPSEAISISSPRESRETTGTQGLLGERDKEIAEIKIEEVDVARPKAHFHSSAAAKRPTASPRITPPMMNNVAADLSPRALDKEIAEMKTEASDDVARPKAHFKAGSRLAPPAPAAAAAMKDSVPALSPRNLDHEIAEINTEEADIARPKSHFRKLGSVDADTAPHHDMNATATRKSRASVGPTDEGTTEGERLKTMRLSGFLDVENTPTPEAYPKGT